jgi:hypothetical protein
MYYRGALAALLVYDITNVESFDEVKGWAEGIEKENSFIAKQWMILLVVFVCFHLHCGDRVEIQCGIEFDCGGCGKQSGSGETSGDYGAHWQTVRCCCCFF